MSVVFAVIALFCLAYIYETIRGFINAKGHTSIADDNKKIKRAFIAAVAAAAFALAAILWDSGKSGDGGGAAETMRINAYLYSRQYVVNDLKAPATADFPMYQPSFVGHSGGSTYYVHAYIDAQNSYGAMLRTKYLVTMEYKGGDANDANNWIATNVSID